MKTILNLLLLSLITFLSGCAISQDVVSVDSGTTIEKIYVLENEKVHMEGLIVELLKQIEELGFKSEAYKGDRPEGIKHYLTYTANWNWDGAMFLTLFRATLYEDGRILGAVEYNSKMGRFNLNKFGRTAEKIRPLLEELLSNVERVSTVSPMGE